MFLAPLLAVANLRPHDEDLAWRFRDAVTDGGKNCHRFRETTRHLEHDLAIARVEYLGEHLALWRKEIERESFC